MANGKNVFAAFGVLTPLIVFFLTISHATFAKDDNSYRWWTTPEGWCVEVERSMLCTDLEFQAESIRPGFIRLRQNVSDDQVPIRILFSFSGIREYALLAEADEQVAFVETYELPGALANVYMAAGVYIFEVELDNNVVVTLHGYEFDDLVGVAATIASGWS